MLNKQPMGSISNHLFMPLLLDHYIWDNIFYGLAIFQREIFAHEAGKQSSHLSPTNRYSDVLNNRVDTIILFDLFFLQHDANYKPHD